MTVPARPAASFLHRPFVLMFLAFVAILWMAGGASRIDVSGQAVVRAAAWACIFLFILFENPSAFFRRGRPVLLFLGASALLAAVQLIPLPPQLWAALPGRSAFDAATALMGGSPPWRPLAIVPSAAQNALASLVVPFVMLCFASEAHRIDDGLLLKALLGMVIASLFLGLFQFAGVALYDPLANRGDDVVGTFGNRNHFAVLMACGLLLGPVWAFRSGHGPGWRGPAVMAAVPLLALAILASGSRAGMAAGVIALAAGIVIVRRPLMRTVSRKPRWVLAAVGAGSVAALAGLVAVSIAADRAVSVNRALALDPSQDMRHRALPTVVAMVRDYLPFGSGLGGFDPLFRLHEPFSLLKLTYFNRAHNDFLEIVLDTGIAGAVLLTLALAWWVWMSLRAWRSATGRRAMMARTGSILLLIVLLASIVDYPARTPIFMALVVIAAIWLDMAREEQRSPLPAQSQAL